MAKVMISETVSDRQRDAEDGKHADDTGSTRSTKHDTDTHVHAG